MLSSEQLKAYLTNASACEPDEIGSPSTKALGEQDLNDAINDPTRIYVTDETRLHIFPKTGKATSAK